ncbi:AfsR/SARP family transcriptional regulator [Nocardioides cynanchi]|uniref:AfsR/SARP family transcriptional regulator n=1 Tax=Nocardioides cynanchi TaxID=2558918 RepID=UPI001EE1A6A9|nr:BTAD domain-containing putative transcriptional regulator [Nocardioides cynanchi]
MQEEWRTGKTRDLLRLLALENGQPVRVSGLIEKLWPDVTVDRARNSLGTAASQIRRTVGEPCVVRDHAALTLRNAWVDVNAFRALAQRAQLAARSSASAEVLTNARAALALYAGDFYAHEDDAPWAVAERDALKALHVTTLCDASRAALELGLLREAQDLATTAVRLDPTVEAATRSLMRSHAELGEVGLALRVFEDCRVHLAEELGTDPSPQTQELHLQILRRPREFRASTLDRLRASG